MELFIVEAENGERIECQTYGEAMDCLAEFDMEDIMARIVPTHTVH